MLRCSDGSLYVGSTRDLHGRVEMHMAGNGSAYTRRRRPVRLVYAAEFESVAEAYAFEKQVQGWSRAKREALVSGDFKQIRRLAKKRFPRKG